jgi:hypothetical protein
MSPQIGVFIIVWGIVLYTARICGYYNHRQKYKLVPAFLIGNGIGFFAPGYHLVDGLVIGLLLVFADQWFLGKKKKTKKIFM